MSNTALALVMLAICLSSWGLGLAVACTLFTRPAPGLAARGYLTARERAAIQRGGH